MRKKNKQAKTKSQISNLRDKHPALFHLILFIVVAGTIALVFSGYVLSNIGKATPDGVTFSTDDLNMMLAARILVVGLIASSGWIIFVLIERFVEHGMEEKRAEEIANAAIEKFGEEVMLHIHALELAKHIDSVEEKLNLRNLDEKLVAGDRLTIFISYHPDMETLCDNVLKLAKMQKVSLRLLLGDFRSESVRVRLRSIEDEEIDWRRSNERLKVFTQDYLPRFAQAASNDPHLDFEARFFDHNVTHPAMMIEEAQRLNNRGLRRNNKKNAADWLPRVVATGRYLVGPATRSLWIFWSGAERMTHKQDLERRWDDGVSLNDILESENQYESEAAK